MSPKADRDWRLYADDIIEACGKVRRYVAEMTYDAFEAEDITHDAVIRNLEVIGEAAGKLRRTGATSPDSGRRTACGNRESAWAFATWCGRSSRSSSSLPGSAQQCLGMMISCCGL